MFENRDSYKGEGNQNNNNHDIPKKPKKIKKLSKYEPKGSKLAPPVETIKEKEEEKNPDYNHNYNDENTSIASNNYNLNYKNLKQENLRIPKPTYSSKTNMNYIEESKKELEEDEKVNSKENSQVENIINDIDKFNLDSSDDNKINIINSNNNIHQEDENYINLKKNTSQIHNPNSKMKNNNTNQDFPSLFDNFSFNQQNNDL